MPRCCMSLFPSLSTLMSSVFPFLHSQASSAPTHHSHLLHPRSALGLHFFALRGTNMFYWNGPNTEAGVIASMGFSTAISCTCSSPKAAFLPILMWFWCLQHCWKFWNWFHIIPCSGWRHILGIRQRLVNSDDRHSWNKKLKSSYCIFWVLPKLSLFPETCRPCHLSHKIGGIPALPA